MDISTLSQKITVFRGKNEANSISPDYLGGILQDIIDVLALSSAAGTEYIAGNIQGCTTDGGAEQPLYMGDNITFRNNSQLLTIESPNDGDAMFYAKKDCLVHITGQINLQPVNSATTDRVLHWYKLDEDGERVADNVITTHFTGTTQIFNIPINHMVYLNQGEFLYLVAYTSGSSQTLISDNSHINVTIKPM